MTLLHLDSSIDWCHCNVSGSGSKWVDCAVSGFDHALGSLCCVPTLESGDSVLLNC